MNNIKCCTCTKLGTTDCPHMGDEPNDGCDEFVMDFVVNQEDDGYMD